MNQGNCTHTDEEKCIVATWVVDEVPKAIEMGYILMNVFEFREYEVTCFDRGSNSGGLFAEYVICSWNWNRNRPATHPEADKDKYIDDYQRAEGIALDKASISKNAGQRTLAKLKLNSKWGKWAQNKNKTQTTLVTSVKELYELLTSPRVEVTNLIFPNDDVWLSRKYSEGYSRRENL